MATSEDLAAKLSGAASNIYPTSFADVSAGFQEKYGTRGWIGELAKSLSGSSTKSGKEYLAARRSLERVASGQHKTLGAKYSGGVKEAGKSLEPKQKEAPAGGLTVTLTFKTGGEKGHHSRTREISVHMDQRIATQYINDPSPAFGPLFSAYFNEGDWDSDDTSGADAYGEDGDYEAEVTGVSVA